MAQGHRKARIWTSRTTAVDYPSYAEFAIKCALVSLLVLSREHGNVLPFSPIYNVFPSLLMLGQRHKD